MIKEMSKNNGVVSGWKYLLLSLGTFMGLALEAVHAWWEQLIYRIPPSDFSVWQIIIHWVITCLTWVGVAYLLIRIAKNKLGFDIFAKGEKMKLWQLLAVLLGIILSLLISYLAWNGFKIIKEFNHNGLLKFIFQYIYYMVETLLFLLIIVFGQKAFEIWTKKRNVPWGGIICGLTWGIAHIISRGHFDIQNGVLSTLLGFLFGAAYVLTNRDLKKSWSILFLMFIL
jgi:hypothetical protein